MSIINLRLSDSPKSFVDEQVAERGDVTKNESVYELIRKDHERKDLRLCLQAGAASAAGMPADSSYFAALRKRAEGLVATNTARGIKR